MKIKTVLYRAGRNNAFGFSEGEYGCREYFAITTDEALAFFHQQIHQNDVAVAVFDGPAYNLTILK